MGIGIGQQFETVPALAARSELSETERESHGYRGSLSAWLLLVTVAFVALAGITVYMPAIANYRTNWFSDRTSAAHIAALVLDAAPEHGLSSPLVQKLLSNVGAYAITVEDGHGRRTIPIGATLPETHCTVDLRTDGWIGAVVGSWHSLTSRVPAVIRLIGDRQDGSGTIEVLVDDTPLRQAMRAFSMHLLLSSFAIASVAAVLVFLILQIFFVRPMRRLARNISDFAESPESAERVIAPSGRIDEIGEAETALARMELTLARELRHKRRLAGLGLSVSKISHELRNLLTTAQLLGDRLEGAADPVVQRVAPRLVETLDRANRFCEATLAYGRAAERHPQRQMLPLAAILDELPDLAALSRSACVDIRIHAPAGLAVDADPEHLSRALTNLVRNAVQALDVGGGASPTVTIEASRIGREGSGSVQIAVTDNGPGLPQRAKTHLFAPFQGSMRAGGTGLGLAIASELIALNGGSLRLDPTAAGARFVMTIPDRPAQAVAA